MVNSHLRQIPYFFFSALLGALFLSKGYDSFALAELRCLLVFSTLVLFLVFANSDVRLSLRRIPLCFGMFCVFCIYQIIRLGFAYFLSATSNGPDKDVKIVLVENFTQQPIVWFFCLGTMALAYVFSASRKRAVGIVSVSIGMVLFLCSLSLPSLITRGSLSAYDIRLNPFASDWLYFHPAVEKYLISNRFHANWIGEVLAVGFFLSISYFIYSFMQFDDEKKMRPIKGQIHLIQILIPALTIGSSFIAILAFNSRGTIIFFLMGVITFIGGCILKYRSRRIFIPCVLIACLLFLFLKTNIDFKATLQEVSTLQDEMEEPQSFAHNIRGANYAVEMFKENPVWGVGTKGYYPYRKTFKKTSPQNVYMADYKAMNHYLTILAEEGLGAWFYFLFILVFFIESVLMLQRTPSRFQFLFGMGFFVPVLMILGHASISFMLDHVNMSLLLCALMGACLGILSPGFRHSK
ncbi:MAG: O-antigen ligase family protein [Candidatus Omnitrophota bacterium]